MPIFDSGYPHKTTAVSADTVLITDSAAADAIKGINAGELLASGLPVIASTITGTTLTGTSLINTGDVELRSTSIETIRAETMFDYVASGGVLAGSGYGSTRGWTLSAGVVYINGKRFTIAATSGTVTASRDTYFDLLLPVSGSVATLVNTGGNIVTNNAASPALAANSVRIGIIVSGASNIASVASVNQGEETKLLPIVSSVPYAVTDSLGNLICPRDPNRKLLGLRRITTTISGVVSTSAIQATGLSCPFIVPTGRKIKTVARFAETNSGSGAMNTYLSLWDGTVGSGTQLDETTSTVSGTNFASPLRAEDVRTLSAGLHTVNAGIRVSASSGSFTASSIKPAYIRVELE